MRRAIVLVLAFLALGAGALGVYVRFGSSTGTAQIEAPVAFGHDRVVVRAATGDLAFDVELATTPEQRARGLMFRERLGPGAGMLFVFEESREASFWMKNTLIALDILFIDAAGTIVRIAERATPRSTTPIPSGAPVVGVLEIAGGRAAELGIAVGDRVLHPSFRGAF